MFNTIWCFINQNTTLVVNITAIITAIIALIGWSSSRKLNRYQIMNEVFQEYRSDEMGKSLLYIWEFKRLCDNKKGDDLIENIIIKEYKDEYEKGHGDGTLHFHRRKVSLYFQFLSCLCLKDRKILKILKELWKGSNMDTIDSILYPIEMNSLPLCMKNEPYEKVPAYINRMKDMNEMIKANAIGIIGIRIRRLYRIITKKYE